MIYPLSTDPTFKDYDVENPIDGLPFTLHPDTSSDTTWATGIARMVGDRGVVFVVFRYEVTLIRPVDRDDDRLMRTT